MSINSICSCLFPDHIYFDSSDSEEEDSPGYLWKSPKPIPITPKPLDLNNADMNFFEKCCCIFSTRQKTPPPLSLNHELRVCQIREEKGGVSTQIKFEVFAGISKTFPDLKNSP